jgi:N-acetylglutamate synthase-like GNAT family acetyltransferase
MFAAAWKILIDSFPGDERRSLAAHIEIEKDQRYAFYAILSDDECTGCMGIWRFPRFMMIEHLAIVPHARSLGMGTDIVTRLLAGASVPVVIEVEPESSGDDAVRRTAFYRSLGFIANDYAYCQPAYDAAKHPVPMSLMTYPAAMNAAMLDDIRDTLYAELYHVK